MFTICKFKNKKNSKKAETKFEVALITIKSVSLTKIN